MSYDTRSVRGAHKIENAASCDKRAIEAEEVLWDEQLCDFEIMADDDGICELPEIIAELTRRGNAQCGRELDVGEAQILLKHVLACRKEDPVCAAARKDTFERNNAVRAGWDCRENETD
jgi:hypothetical protein